jgi:tRNA 2-thiocytidine biosynthesis protein TtcA
MELQKLYSKVRQAVDAYQMIEDGDKIAIGISGQSDTLVCTGWNAKILSEEI